MKKEIFILCPNPPEVLGGMEACVRQQVVGLEERGYKVRVFHRENSGSESTRHLINGLYHHVRDVLYGYCIGREAQKAMNEGVEAVFSHSVVGWYPLKVPAGCKKFHFYHGTFRGQAKAIRPFISFLGYLKLTWWDSMVLERMSGRGKQVFSCSEFIRVEVKRFFGYQSISLGYPLDMADFRPRNQRECREKLGLPIEGVLAVYAGTTQPNKNFPVVERLIRDLPEVTWVLALRGLADAGREYGSNVRVMPNVPRNLIPELYSAADFTVCPSRYDPFPYVVTEALSCGVPVLASLNGSSQQFLGVAPLDRLIISNPNDLDGFVAAARDLALRPEFYRKAVMASARPAVMQWMNPNNWWTRFHDITGL